MCARGERGGRAGRHWGACGALSCPGGLPRFQEKRWHRAGLGRSPGPRRVPGGGGRRAGPGGREGRGAGGTAARGGVFQLGFARPPRSPSAPSVSSAPWKRRAGAEPSEASAAAPWGAPHSGPRCCRRRCCFCCCCRGSRRAAPPQVGPEAGQPPRRGALCPPGARLRWPPGGACARWARVWAPRGESRRSAPRLRAPRDPSGPTLAPEATEGSWAAGWSLGTWSGACHRAARGRGAGGRSLAWKEPLPAPLEVPGHPGGGRARAAGQRPPWTPRAGPLPHPPTPPAGDSEKVCASGREVPADSGDLGQALGDTRAAVRRGAWPPTAGAWPLASKGPLAFIRGSRRRVDKTFGVDLSEGSSSVPHLGVLGWQRASGDQGNMDAPLPPWNGEEIQGRVLT